MDRVELLEREVRRLRRLVTGLAVAGVAIVGVGAVQRVPDRLEARSFVLVDAQGRPAARLDVEGNSPGLRLLDAEGKPRAILSMLGGRPQLVLASPEDGAMVGLSINARGEPGFLAIDGGGKRTRLP